MERESCRWWKKEKKKKKKKRNKIQSTMTRCQEQEILSQERMAPDSAEGKLSSSYFISFRHATKVPQISCCNGRAHGMKEVRVGIFFLFLISLRTLNHEKKRKKSCDKNARIHPSCLFSVFCLILFYFFYY
jgi:hypothetical protein